MDIENFSKTDLIYTALLISFVTALMTAIVVIFLLEDAPKDVIQIREHLISSEATSTAATGTMKDVANNNGESATDAARDMSRDKILEKAVGAVARVKAVDLSPQAGVLLSVASGDLVITSAANYPLEAQGLFEDGVVVDLEVIAKSDNFSWLQVIAASNTIYPLSLTEDVPEVGSGAFVVPLTQRPEIVHVTITEVSNEEIQTSAGELPATSLLFSDSGELLGVFGSSSGAFLGTEHIRTAELD
ncbi:MAG: hypothetical protein WD335_02590 [Candidatus Paceibacterota bacterium]